MERQLTDALRAIRAKCLDCSGKSLKLVERCDIRRCPLWGYRLCQTGQSEEKKTGQRPVRQMTIWEDDRR